MLIFIFLRQCLVAISAQKVSITPSYFFFSQARSVVARAFNTGLIIKSEQMKTHNLGYPRIGSHRELKKACEQYWSGKITSKQLTEVAKMLRLKHWSLQKETGIDLIPSNDFSYYDQVLDLSLTLGAIPARYADLPKQTEEQQLDLYFAMARGYQKNGVDVTAMEMTKWFDTNYHYIVPEFTKNQHFKLTSNKTVQEFKEAKAAGISTKPVLLGPISYLLLGKIQDNACTPTDLLSQLLPVYIQLLKQLEQEGAQWIQIDEPFLAMDISDNTKALYQEVFTQIKRECPSIKILLATYFNGLKDNLEVATHLPVCCLHIDLVRCPEQLDHVIAQLPNSLSISLGVVDGRNIWKNDYISSLHTIRKVTAKLGTDRIFVAPSCSLLHSPCDLELEDSNQNFPAELKQWLAFAKQKLNEVVVLKKLATEQPTDFSLQLLKENAKAIESRKNSTLIHNPAVKDRVAQLSDQMATRNAPFSSRKEKQKAALSLPLYPTTTIGSFPQTTEVRRWRSQFKKNEISKELYTELLEEETKKAIIWQEEIGLDVLVHGEFERNDMVEYFGEQLDGFAFTKYGWVQSYGSRCVKPPIIYGDVARPAAMTVAWAKYAQSLTSKYVKGMLTGPVTILQWSFVRNDQPREITCNQIALAIRDEVKDLETAGIKIIQIDEPAIREGLPLRTIDHAAYLDWAVRAFRISASGVQDETQIHTHMCYSEFNGIIKNISDMDADVITIECSRSHMELLDAFADFKYPNEIGPGVYDIHSPRVPSKEEILTLLEKASAVIPADQLWVNPDCGLKTRHWDETKKALTVMVEAAQEMATALA